MIQNHNDIRLGESFKNIVWGEFKHYDVNDCIIAL